MIANMEVHLVSRPAGMPTPANFALIATEIPAPADGEVLVRNLYLSVDPYMRGRMKDVKSYVPPFELNKVMTGGAVGEVVESKAASLKQGDIVLSTYGWREYFTAPATHLTQVNPEIKPLSIYLGTMGITGLTAWAGLKLVDVKAGDVVFVSGAAGAVGNVAGQLAKIYGCRVIGSAGSDEKVKFLKEQCGFDDAFNYKSGPSVDLLQAAEPDGIDVYFDNVGGDSLFAALASLRVHGRIIACGMISSYNNEAPTPGPSNLSLIVGKRLTMKGMIVSDSLNRLGEFIQEASGYVKAGKLHNQETVVKGIENAVDAFLGLFHGSNVGKMVVEL
jgi:NADPH-dependent curcumin reductase CurA